MKIASVATTITVSSATRRCSTRASVSSGTDFTQDQLKSIPTARDPWVVLQQVPGVLRSTAPTWRAARAASSRSTSARAPTRRRTPGSSTASPSRTCRRSARRRPTTTSTRSRKCRSTTGGSDPSIAVPGVTLNMVTKRGTNEVHGSRAYLRHAERDGSSGEPTDSGPVQRHRSEGRARSGRQRQPDRSTSRTTAWKPADRSGPTRPGCGAATGAIRST